MQEILMRFSDRVVLSTAMQELRDHQHFLAQQLAKAAAEPRLATAELRPPSAELRPPTAQASQANAAAQPLAVADLSRLREVDTSALAVLLHLDRESRSRLGRPLMIRSAPENLRSLARLSSLESVMSWE